MVPQRQTQRRTYSNPSFIALKDERTGTDRGWAGGRIRNTASVEAAKDAASTANAEPAPRPATSAPPTAGPARRSAIGRTNWSSELAAARSAAGTMSGTIASKAGVKKAVPTP